MKLMRRSILAIALPGLILGCAIAGAHPAQASGEVVYVDYGQAAYHPVPPQSYSTFVSPPAAVYMQPPIAYVVPPPPIVYQTPQAIYADPVYAYPY